MKLMYFLFLWLVTLPGFAQNKVTLNMATYNLRYNTVNDSANAWPYRKELVKALIRYHGFDIVGTQEGLREQLNDLAQMQEYAFTGVGRDDGKLAGEHSAIFYRKDKFELLATGDFWLSETPAKPSKGWDATCCNRLCTWAKFKVKQTGKVFFVFNVHFDHQGVEARKQSARLLLQQMKTIAADAVTICMGDLNSTPETEQISTLRGVLQDAYEATQMAPYGPVGTFNGFRWNSIPKDRIDYIFVSRPVRVLTYAALSDGANLRYPSDHFPVLAKLEW
jgi:endonuclease/exonuclease/phosphatase family metal-dependent hydrolase